MKIIKLVSCITLCLCLISCGEESFVGKYEAAEGMQEFNFKSNGYMVQSLRGNKVAEFKFKKDGDEIKVYMSDNAAQIFTLNSNGELVGPGGIKLTPKK